MTWSSRDSESRIEPSPLRAIMRRALSEICTPSASTMVRSRATTTPAGIRLKSKRWTRDSTVSGIFWGSVVANRKTTWGGGSSRVFNSALKAPVESMWTSSMR